MFINYDHMTTLLIRLPHIGYFDSDTTLCSVPVTTCSLVVFRITFVVISHQSLSILHTLFSKGRSLCGFYKTLRYTTTEPQTPRGPSCWISSMLFDFLSQTDLAGLIPDRFLSFICCPRVCVWIFKRAVFLLSSGHSLFAIDSQLTVKFPHSLSSSFTLGLLRSMLIVHFLSVLSL